MMRRMMVLGGILVSALLIGCEEGGLPSSFLDRADQKASDSSSKSDAGAQADAGSGGGSATDSGSAGDGGSTADASASGSDSASDDATAAGGSETGGGATAGGPANKMEDLDLSGTEPYGWTDAKPGWMAKYRMPNDQIMIQEVEEVRDKALLMRTRILQGGNEITNTLMWMPRYAKKGEEETPDNVEIKQLDDETVTVAGNSLECEVHQTKLTMPDKVITSIGWINKDVPGWTVRTKTDATGDMALSMELIEYRK